MRQRARFAPSVFVAVLVLSAAARADVVGPPPSGCPEGTTGVTSHCPSCVPDSCASDADCDPDEHCAERSFCTRVYETCGGWGGPGATDAHTECDPEASTCASDSPCRAHRVCVAGAATDGGPRRELVRYGCGCGVAGRGAEAAWVSFGALALALAWRRRRAHSTRRR